MWLRDPCESVVCIQVEARQKLIESKESEEDKEKKSSINEDAPGI